MSYPITKSYFVVKRAFTDTRWYNRRELAQKLGRAGKRLHDGDLKALDLLMAEGAIEGRCPPHMRGGRQWEYRKVNRE